VKQGGWVIWDEKVGYRAMDDEFQAAYEMKSLGGPTTADPGATDTFGL
jgi:hypothetical protein